MVRHFLVYIAIAVGASALVLVRYGLAWQTILAVSLSSTAITLIVGTIDYHLERDRSD